MKVSYKWINEILNGKAPRPEKIDELLTMNAMEVEGIEKISDDFVIDAKTTPNLNHHCLCHRGIAGEIAVLANIKANKYSRNFIDISKINKSNKKLEVKIEDPKLCRRYIGRVIENIKVGPSPKWLKEKMEVFGQKSINNVVDATNFVMLELGQPMHAFDADKLSKGDLRIVVKNAVLSQKITTLDGKEVELDESILLITDGLNPLAIAGIKGGRYAELDMYTTNIVLESANFNPVSIRKSSQKTKVQTDASKRYENDLTPELCDEAMDILTKLVIEIAGTPETKVGDMVDNYPRRANKFILGVSSREASSIIGIDIKDKDIEQIFNKIGFEWKKVRPIDEIIKVAKDLEGTKYKMGASISYDAPNLFDCSGFVSYCFSRGGIQIPRISVDQYVFGNKIEEKDLKVGDVIFSNTKEGKIHTKTIEFIPGKEVEEGVDHCGIYLGDGKVIHATDSFGKVIIEKLNSSERFKNIVGYRRFSDNSERFVIVVPDVRLDLRIKEDLAEEIGRIYGYNKVKDIKLPKLDVVVNVDKSFSYKEKIRRILYEEGFSEIMNYSFVEKGDVELLNPMSPEKKALRTNLTDQIKNSLEFNSRHSEIIDMPQIRVFEFGHVFLKDSEPEHFVVGVKNPLGFKKPKEKEVLDNILKILSEKLNIVFKKINTDENVAEFDFTQILKSLPDLKSYEMSEVGDKNRKYKKISAYPFMIRDIAVFTPEGIKAEDVLKIINKEAGELMVKNRLFDVFTKTFEDGSKKTSYAYRIIFQSYEKTLSDIEVNAIMERITNKMNSNKGWLVR